jgi:hypothetical protein
MYKNVKHQRRPEGPWPEIPPCWVCQPAFGETHPEYRVEGGATIVSPTGPLKKGATPLWQGQFYSPVGGDGCNLLLNDRTHGRYDLNRWVVNGVTSWGRGDPGTPEYFFELKISGHDGTGAAASAPLWRGRKVTGPDARGVYAAELRGPNHPMSSPATLRVVPFIPRG